VVVLAYLVEIAEPMEVGMSEPVQLDICGCDACARIRAELRAKSAPPVEPPSVERLLAELDYLEHLMETTELDRASSEHYIVATQHWRHQLRAARKRGGF
jgi:hypothetical protein